jgi:hypothetical protein
MGNLCIKDNKLNKKFKCTKCNDTIDIYKNNTRKHCRFHTLNIYNICVDCKLDTNHCSKNCHHVRKHFWYSNFC